MTRASEASVAARSRARTADGASIARPSSSIGACGIVPGARQIKDAVVGEHTPDRHFVLRQRPGLVGADHRRAAERLDDWQAADEGVALDHPPYADGERDRHNGGQRLRHDGDSQCDTEHEHLERRQAASEADHNDECDHDEGGLCQCPTQAVEVLLEGCSAGFHRLHHSCDTAELGGHAGGDHDRVAAAVDDERPRVRHVLAVAERQTRVVERGRGLVGSSGFPGQRRLVNGQIDGVDDACISRDTVACAQHHDVSGHEIARRNGRFFAVAQHVRRRGGHSSQRFQRLACAVFLDEAEEHREQHDDGDDDRLERVAEETGDDRGAEENHDQRVLELREEGMPRGLRAQRLQFVRAVYSETLDRDGGGQPGGMGREPRRYSIDRQRMPGGSGVQCLLDRSLLRHTHPPRAPRAR